MTDLHFSLLSAELDHPALAAEVARVARTRHLSADTTLLREGDGITVVPIVRSGSVRVSRQDEDGREILLYYIQPGESCIMSLLAGLYGTASRVTAVVEEDADVQLLPVEFVTRWLTQYPAWARYVFQLYAQRFEELLTVINAVAFHRLNERLLDLLREKSRQAGCLELHLTHAQLAADLGTAREVVSRLLKQLERGGQVSLGRNRVTLLLAA